MFRCGAVTPNLPYYGYHNYGYSSSLGNYNGTPFREITLEAAYAADKVVVTADYNLLWAFYMNPTDWRNQAQNPPPSPPGQTPTSHALKQQAVYPHNKRSSVSFADGSVGFAEITDPSWYGTAGVDAHFDPRKVR